MIHKKSITFVTTLLIAITASARASELDDLKATMQQMQQTMQQMQTKITQLEEQNAKEKQKQQHQAQQAQQPPAAQHQAAQKTPPAPPAEGPAAAQTPYIDANGNEIVTLGPSTVTVEGHSSEVAARPAMNDQQEAAPRPNDLTLDPAYRGFIPVPNTPVLIKFNAKPRLDFTEDPANTGNGDRFVTATIPVDGDPFKGGGNQFNANAKGSQLSIDVRAPEIDGSPRFYFQNDFYGGSGGDFPLRVRQLYGSIFNVTLGQTYSVFEDPDAWPDTVDYEGPNSAIFARRPLVRYALPLDEHWNMNFGIEKPSSEVDLSNDPNARQVNHAPDGGLNIRWEDSKIGHVQLGAIFRDIAAKGPIVGNQSTFGWGLNLAGSFNLTENDSVQAQVTYGQGIFRYFNDDFVNNDAAYNKEGQLTAIPAFGGMIGYTHKWTDSWRSTVSYGYVELDDQHSQGPTAYRFTHYVSGNLVWQIRKRLSIGLEGLYGKKEEQSGADGDAFRIELGIVYSIFD